MKEGTGAVQAYAEGLLNRSAGLVAVQMVGKLLDRDTTFHGRILRKGIQYKQRVEEAIKQMSPNHQISFIQISDSGILGAAKLVT